MYTEEEMLEIYVNLRKGIVTREELIPIKKELIFIAKRVKFKYFFAITDLINALHILEKENKLDFINQELIDFAKQIGDTTILPDLILGLTFDDNRLINDISENTSQIYSLLVSFTGSFNSLLSNYNNFNYLNKINNKYTNVLVKYMNVKEKLMAKNYKLADMYILSSVLDIITTYVYINIDAFDYKYDLIETCMQIIENDIITYFVYFIENGLWVIDYGVTPKSIGGFKQEFIVIGEVVNKIYADYQKELKKLNM